MKTFRLFTGHPVQRSMLPADLRGAKDRVYYRDLGAQARRERWQRFRAGLEPLVRAGKLGAAVFGRDKTLAFEREHGLAHVSASTTCIQARNSKALANPIKALAARVTRVHVLSTTAHADRRRETPRNSASCLIRIKASISQRARL